MKIIVTERAGKEDKEQQKFYQWAEALAGKKELSPMTPEEIALFIKQDKVEETT